MIERIDDFSTRREHLKKMSDAELKEYFLKLSEQIVDPLFTLAYENTSKSIERSVLLRMGFSSIEAKTIVDSLDENNLLSKGAGHSIYLLSIFHKISIREAGKLIQTGEGLEYVKEYFINHE